MPTVAFTVSPNPVSEIYGQPWTIGQPFNVGHYFPGNIKATGVKAFQADVRNLWEDGSVKFAVLSGVTDGDASVTIDGEGVLSSGPNVPEPDLSSVVVTIAGDGNGQYSPSSVVLESWDKNVAHKKREFLGPVMSEFHYYSPTSDPHLSIWWYVRAYVTGHVEVETVVENGWLYVPESTHKEYSVSVSVGGAETFSDNIGLPFWTNAVRKSDSVFRFPASSCRSNFPAGCKVDFKGEVFTVVSSAYVSGGTDVTVDGELPSELGYPPKILAHPHHTRWSRIDWIGGDPAVAPMHDGEYIMSTPLVPRFFKEDGPPSDAVVRNLDVPLLPFERGDWPRTVGASGSNSEPFRREAAHYIKWGLAKAWYSTMAHCASAGRYPIIYRDEATGEPPNYADYPQGAYAANSAILSTGVTSAGKRFPCSGVQPPVWKASHAPQTGYPGYILSGRWAHMELAEFEAQTNWWVSNTKDNSFEDSRIANARTSTFAPRGSGWAMRAMANAVVCVPDFLPRQMQYVRHLEKTLAYYDVTHTGKNAVYMVQPNNGYTANGINGKNVTNQANFQQNFLSYGAGWAFLLAGHKFTDPRAESFVKWRMNEPVARSGATEFCWRDAAGSYVTEYAPVAASASAGATPEEFNAACHTSWLDVYTRTFGHPPSDCSEGNTLRGEGGGKPSILTRDPGSNWAIQQATIALAVDLGIPGAADAWAKLSGADNWNPVGFNNLPDWGIIPRKK